MMRPALLAMTLASATAISLPARTPALRPSVSAFRPSASLNEHLRGGSGDLVPLDAAATLKLTAAVYALYGVLNIPDTGLPLLDMTFKNHATQNSIFYGDEAPMTDSNKGALRWTGVSFLGLAGLCQLASEGDADTQKKTCKWMTFVSAMNLALMIINKHPVACGGPVVVPIIGALCAANGF